MIKDEDLLSWVEVLTGLERSRVQNAMARVKRWKIKNLDKIVESSTIDGLVATTLLSEAVERLRDFGIPETKLLAKLRRDPDVWPVWAELRAASLLLNISGGHFELETDRKMGKHADFRLSFGGSAPVPMEFKAIGYSDDEANFCKAFASTLDLVLPPRGFITLHAQLATRHINADIKDILRMHSAAAQMADSVPDYPEGLTGVTIVGHGGEDNYARRLSRRLITEVVAQIPEGQEGWAVFHWSNGAPITDVIKSIQHMQLPKRIAGIIMIGDAVAFPNPNIHAFISILPQGSVAAPTTFISQSNADMATVVFNRFEKSSGVRNLLLAANTPGGQERLLRRDGTERILPFNFLVDEDPEPAEMLGKIKTRLG